MTAWFDHNILGTLLGILGAILGPLFGLIWPLIEPIGSFLAENPTLRFAILSLSKSTVFIVVCVFSLGIPACVYFERKIAAYMQDRVGPNRVGPFGILQPIADALKFFFKEDVIPGHVDKALYVLAPMLALIPVFLAFAAIPFGPGLAVAHGYISPASTGAGAESMMLVPMVLADMEMGLLYVFAITSLGVYGISLGGWASNSKYAIFGGVRAAAQMISYEITLGLSIVGVFVFAESLNLSTIMTQQVHGTWNVFTQPVGFFIFMVSYFAETNRLPFDLPEAETEIVAGYHIEYSSMKFAMFFMAEYAAMIVASAMITVMFFGGYDIPGINLAALADQAIQAGNAGKVSLIGILGFLVMVVKIALCLFFFMLIRWTIPRFRYDQLMHLGWKFFMPLGLANVLISAIIKLTIAPDLGQVGAKTLLAIWALNLVAVFFASVLQSLGGVKNG